MHVLIELTPLDPVTGTRPTLRLSSTQDRTVNGLNSVRWWPGILRKPSLSIGLFDGDFTSVAAPGQAALDLSLVALEKLDSNARRFVWAGAGITIYAGTSGQSWPWASVFSGKVKSFRAAASKLSVTATIDDEPFSVQVLSASYAGTGGIEGGADIKGKPKPWAFGAPKNIEPVLIDSVDSVFQVSAYGAIKNVVTLYERGAAFGASYGDYANYAALVAAAIPAGRWATCLASGLIRLGAPPYGLITADIEGDYQGGTWRRLPGAILQRIASALSISSGALDTTSLNALDTYAATLPSGGNISLYLTEQGDFLDLAQRIVLSFNAQACISWLGQLFVARATIGSSVATLDSQQARLPRVTECVETDVSPPYSKIQMGAQKCWRVHTFDEIAFQAELIDKGQYDAAVAYREGNIVTMVDGSRWVFIGATPLTGSTPSDANANWDRMVDAVSLPLGSNLVVNSEFTNGLTGWALGGFNNTGLTFSSGLDLAGWSGTKHVAYAVVSGTPAAGTVFDAYNSIGGPNTNLTNLQRWAVPVLPGEKLYYSALVAGHRCTVAANLQYRDANGAYLTEVSSSHNTGSPNFANGDPANAQRVGAFHTVPNGARFAFLNIRGLCPGGQANPYIFFSDGFIAKVDPNQTAIPPYTMGPGNRRADVTGENTANNTANVGSTSATTVESGANAANAGVNSDGTIKNDKVGSGAIVLGAVSGQATAYTDAAVSINTLNSWVDLQTCVYASIGKPVSLWGQASINYYVQLDASAVEPDGCSFWVRTRLLCDGVEIVPPKDEARIDLAAPTSATRFQYGAISPAMHLSHTPAAGTHTYQLQAMIAESGHALGTVSTTSSATRRALTPIELRRSS